MQLTQTRSISPALIIRYRSDLFRISRMTLLVIALFVAFVVLVKVISRPAPRQFHTTSVLAATDYFQTADITYQVTSEEIIYLKDIIWVRFHLTIHGSEWRGNCTIHANSNTRCYMYSTSHGYESLTIITSGKYQWS